MKLRNVPSIPTLWRVLIRKGCCILSNAFSASTERIIWFLSFSFQIKSKTLIDLWMLNHAYQPGMNPTWSWWIIFLMYCWILSFKNRILKYQLHLNRIYDLWPAGGAMDLWPSNPWGTWMLVSFSPWGNQVISSVFLWLEPSPAQSDAGVIHRGWQ